MSSLICSAFVAQSGGADEPVTSSANEQIGSAKVADLQALFNDIAASTGVAGAQVSVIIGDQRADFIYGSANAELGVPMTVDTVTQVGSTTKMFTAALVMTLVDEGKLDLDTPDEIRENAGGLRYLEFNEELRARYEELNAEIQTPAAALVDEELIPLGNDRFLLKFPGFANGIPVAFFGKDPSGRATNINSGLRTGRRVE